MSLPASISGFTVFPISYNSTSTHCLYARSHTTKASANAKDNNTLPNGRTLFLVNLPPHATEREVMLFFKQYGTVERVLFDFEASPTNHPDQNDDSSSEDEEENVEQEVEDPATTAPRRKRRKLEKDNKPQVIPLPAAVSLRTLRKTGRSAHLIFLDNSSVARCLPTPATSQKPRPWPVSDEPTGLAHYLARYTSLRPPLDAVRAHADSYMTVFEAELARSKVGTGKYKKGEAIVDEDGFTLVVRGGAYGQTVGGGVGVASKRFQASAGNSGGRHRKPKGADTKEGFYAFQKAEKQRNDLMNLRKNWEADKAKVEKLKESRRFKPY